MLKDLKDIKIWVSIFALLISLASLWKSCINDNELNKLNYYENAVNYRPRFEVIKTEISGTNVKIFNTKISGKQNYLFETVLDVLCSLQIIANITVVNKGNTIGNYIGYMFTDKASGESYLREVLTREDSTINNIPFEDYFKKTDIKPNDTLVINISTVVQHWDESNFTLHLLLLYGNELGVLYDTYHWVKYETAPLLAKPEYFVSSENIGTRFIYNSKQYVSGIKEIDHNTSWEIYPRPESKKIKIFLSKFVTKETISKPNKQ